MDGVHLPITITLLPEAIILINLTLNVLLLKEALYINQRMTVLKILNQGETGGA